MQKGEIALGGAGNSLAGKEVHYWRRGFFGERRGKDSIS